MKFHEKLARLLEDRNVSEVSRRAGMGVSTLGVYLYKRSIPRADFCLCIARVLCVSVEWLLDDSQGWPPVWVNPPEQQASATGGDSVKSEPAGAIAGA